MKRLLSLVLLICLAVSLLPGCDSIGAFFYFDRGGMSSAQSSTDPSSDASVSEPDSSSSLPESSSQTQSSQPAEQRGPEPEFTPSDDLPENLIGLETKKIGFGQGTRKDEQNRPSDALLFNESFRQYNAIALNESSEHIYLTFDEGYEYENLTTSFLDTLKEKDVKAVFFLTHHYAKTNPELVQRMIDDGHIIGNHSYAHKSLPDISPEDAQAEVQKMHDYMLETFGYEMTLFRMPAGEYSEATLALVGQMGYTTLFWSFAYKDWEVDNQPEPAASLERLVNNLHKGAIYLLHPCSTTNAEILGDFIDAAREEGYTFAPFTVG